MGSEMSCNNLTMIHPCRVIKAVINVHWRVLEKNIHCRFLEKNVHRRFLEKMSTIGF